MKHYLLSYFRPLTLDKAGISCYISAALIKWVLFLFFFTVITSAGKGQTASPVSQIVCNGSNTAAVTFSGGPAGGNFSTLWWNTIYSWTNDTPGIGLPANGTGNISSFVASNTTASPINANITVTPRVNYYRNWALQYFVTLPPITVTITVNPLITPGSIAGDQTICSNQDPVAFTSSLPGSGTGAYVWESSVNGGASWSPIAGATGLTYDPPVLNVSTQFHRISTSTWGSLNCSSLPGNIVTVTIRPIPIVTPIPSSSTVCPGTNLNINIPTVNTVSVTWSRTNPTGVTGVGMGASGTATGTAPNFSVAYTNLLAVPSGSAQTTVFTFTATSTLGCISTATSTWTVTATPSITTNAGSQDVCEPSPAIFTVNASGEFLQWQEYNSGTWSNLSDSPPYNGVKTNQLTVSPTSSALSGRRYRCVVTACGTTKYSNMPDIASNWATLTVRRTPVVNTNPNSQTLCAGSTASFLTGATISYGTLSYQWEYNTGTGWANVPAAVPYSGVTGINLIINPVNAGMNGYQYRCKVSATTGGCFVYSNPATLKIYNTPSITQQPAISPVCEGGNLTLQILANGIEPLTYQWKVNTGSGFSNIPAGAPYSGENSNTLIITGIPTAMNGYSYQCIVSGSCSTSATSQTVVLTVNSSSITVQPIIQTDCLSGNAPIWPWP